MHPDGQPLARIIEIEHADADPRIGVGRKKPGHGIGQRNLLQLAVRHGNHATIWLASSLRSYVRYFPSRDHAKGMLLNEPASSEKIGLSSGRWYNSNRIGPRCTFLAFFAGAAPGKLFPCDPGGCLLLGSGGGTITKKLFPSGPGEHVSARTTAVR